MTDPRPKPKYQGPDWVRNALALLRALSEEPGEQLGIMDDHPMFRMANKANELGLCAQGEVGSRARETMYGAVQVAQYFAAKYAAAAGRTLGQVIQEAALEFEASIPDIFESHGDDIPDN